MALPLLYEIANFSILDHIIMGLKGVLSVEDHPVRVVVLQSNCPKYKAGDVVVFEGAFVNKEKSDALCMVALNAIYPFVYAARRGGSVKPTPVQCPDCDECVRFQVERIESNAVNDPANT